MLKLHGFSVSNYANMVKQCLIEKGIEFEQLDARPSQDADFLAMSPMGKVPCLETADGFLIETSVILDYLEEACPEPPMYPSDVFARAKASRPEVEKGLRAFRQLADFGPYVMGSEFGNADIFVYHSFYLASRILKRIYDWDIRAEIPGLAGHAAVMEERDATKRVVADNEKAMAVLMAQLEAAK